MALVKALIVEDDKDDLEILKHALMDCARSEEEVFFVDSAPSVEIANQMRRIENHDLYLIDYCLSSSWTGLDLAKQIYARDRNAAIILCSGRDAMTLDAEAVAWVSSGQLTFVHKKDIAKGPLRKAVHEVLGREIRLLIVEDDPEDYELASLELCQSTAFRYTTEHARSIAEALEKMPRGFDAALVDIRLGSESGLDLVREMFDKNIDLPVILVTGAADVELGEDMVRLIGRRHVGFLSKNAMSVNALTNTLQRVGGRRLA